MSFTIYQIISLETNTCLYVGRTKRDVSSRIQEHYDSAHRLSGFKKSELVLAANFDYLDYHILEEDLNSNQAKIKEKEYVQLWRPEGNTYLQ